MKKLILSLFILIVSACGEDVNNSNPPQGPALSKRLVYNAAKLITSGPSLLEQSMSFYTGITNAWDRAIIRALVDYTIFPVGFDEVDGFDKRLKMVLGGEDKTNKLQQLLDQFSSAGLTGLTQISINGSSKRRAADNPFWDPSTGSSKPTQFDKDAKKFIKNSVVNFGINILMGSAPVVELMSIFGFSPDTFKDEVRASLKRIEKKLEEIHQTTAQILHEVSLLGATIPTYINHHAITEIKNRFQGTLLNYSQAANQQLGIISLSNYFLVGQFNTDLLNFITFAKEYHSYSATTNTNNFVADAPYCTTNKGHCFMIYESKGTKFLQYGLQFVQNPTTRNQLPGFANPQKYLPLSHGDLETIGHMMLTRLRCNALFFKGTTLSNNNHMLAESYIQQLQEFKTAANNLYVTGYTTHNTWKIGFTNTFSCQVTDGYSIRPSTATPGWTFLGLQDIFISKTYYTFSTYNDPSHKIPYSSNTSPDKISLINYIPYNNSIGKDSAPPSSFGNITSQQYIDTYALEMYSKVTNDSHYVWNALSLKFEDERRRAMMEYLNPYIARLVALETLLRSYL